MNILYFTWISLEPENQTGAGVHKKIYSQLKALKQEKGKVFLGFKSGKDSYKIEGDGRRAEYDIIGEWPFYKKLVAFLKENKIRLVYLRNDKWLSVFKLSLLLKLYRIKTILEIPTYPFIGETLNNGGKLYNFFRLLKYHLLTYVGGLFLDRIVTYSDDKRIWGVKTIRISNGINPAQIPLSTKVKSDVFRITAVANPAFWHGYDRLIEGCKEYVDKGLYKKQPISITIVGGNPNNAELKRLKSMVDNYELGGYIKFTGQIYGKELDEIFNHTDICIGSLGRHRSGNKSMKALKNVEFAMRGLPFCYSENNSDFDNSAYIHKVPQDDSPLDISELLLFYQSIDVSPEYIRNSVSHLSWNVQMKKVIDEAYCLTNSSHEPLK